jgi:hypothetical protein
MAVKEDDPRIGSVLADRYQILERLSSGAMGVVYRAERKGLGRIVAVKFLHAAFAFSTDFTRRFELEARTMSRLDHPNCVSVIDFGVADAPFIVMDFVTGTTLKDLLLDGPLPPARALAITRQILAGLAHAHEKGIVHRDVKPANIMLTQATGTGDHVRILDFGLAKLVDTDASLSSVVVGTPSYMSPEQAGAKKVDARADIYATAVVLFELLTGEKPFHSEQALQLIRMHIEKPPPALREMRPGTHFSDALEAAVRKALAKAPGDRFQTPEDFAAALEATPEAVPARRATSGSSPNLPLASPGGRVPIPTGLGFSHAATMHAPPPGAERPGHVGASWLTWIIGAAVVFGGLYTWNALGRPGLGKRSAASPPAAVAPAASLQAARKLVSAGKHDEALRMLNELRRASPHDAGIYVLLGHEYFTKGACAETIAAYIQAVGEDARTGRDPQLVRESIACLEDDRTQKARPFIRNKLGAAALPELRAASRSGKSAGVRQAAAELVQELSGR